MKKARWLWLLLPLLAGALWMRSLASWRPKVVFAGPGAIAKLVFSGDGETLLVSQDSPPKLQPARATLTALDANNFDALWQRADSADFGNPHFFAGDSKVLVDGGQIMILNARDGKSLREFDLCCRAAISSDGKWLAVGDFDADGRVYINSPAREIPNGPQGVQGIHALGRREETARAFEFSPDGKTLVVGRGDAKGAYLDFYETQTWKRTRSVPEPKVARAMKAVPGTDLPFFRSLEWSRDGKLILYKCVVNRAGGASLWRLRRVGDAKSLGFAFSLTMSPAPQNDGSALRFFSNSDLALVKPPGFNSRFEPSLSSPGEVLTAAALSPDGAFLVIGTQSGRVIRMRLK